MPTPTYEKVPLTTDEAKWFLKIYQLRYSDLFYAGFRRCLLYSLIVSVFITNIAMVLGIIFSGNEGGTFLSRSVLLNITCCLILAIVLCITLTAFVYQYMILPYKTDAHCGKKFRVPFTVISKEYYVITNQYFFRLSNNYEKLYEVDQHTYDSVDEGGTIFMYRGINSGHIFGQNDTVSIKFFTFHRHGGD